MKIELKASEGFQQVIADGKFTNLMTDTDWIAWRAHLGISNAEAARRLGIGKNVPAGYETGKKIPRYIALACAALAFGLPGWKAG